MRGQQQDKRQLIVMMSNAMKFSHVIAMMSSNWKSPALLG